MTCSSCWTGAGLAGDRPVEGMDRAVTHVRAPFGRGGHAGLFGAVTGPVTRFCVQQTGTGVSVGAPLRPAPDGPPVMRSVGD
jgi:hypothetical protein